MKCTCFTICRYQLCNFAKVAQLFNQSPLTISIIPSIRMYPDVSLKQFPLVLLQGRSLFLYIFLYLSFSCSWASDKVNLSSLIFFCSKLNLWDTSMMIFVSKVCSFWLPRNIALYDYISLPVFPLGDRIWVVYSFPLLWIKLLWIFVYRCLCKYTFSSLGGSNAQ